MMISHLRWNFESKRKSQGHDIPEGYILIQSYPDTVNPDAIISFPRSSSKDQLSLFDVTRHRLRTLINVLYFGSERSVTLDGRDDHVLNIPAGSYFYRR